MKSPIRGAILLEEYTGSLPSLYPFPFIFHHAYKPSFQDQIYGLWFFSTEDCARLYNLLKKLQEEIRSGKIPTPPANDDIGASNMPESVAPPNESNQLLDLLKSTQPAPSTQGNNRENSLASTVRPSSSSQEKSDKEKQKPKEEEPGMAGASVSEMPVLLQKLMIQEQPKLISKVGSSVLTSEDLEKDLLRSAKPKHAQFQEMYTSVSAASLAALSNRSIHGSDGEADANELESTVSSRAPADDSAFAIGSGAATPPLNKLQFASALIHLMQTDDHFLAQIHQAYVDAINKRISRT
ncbi:hypothetical protein Y032_0200g1698 [Ancylostoma ceylanicum]|uniref:mRNA-decapping enzyme C-terminal domain-containing protein n=1 Tax=Ancylostoma ceylanicum TaxID=53326 RepID=A0A016SNP0_9BILA|nr:hypothetical protein Y032_0200g1698 [Ancylostoma ceylanicum]